MMDNSLRKAAEMALDALRYTCDHLPAKTGVEREVDEAITALQVALAHLEQRHVIDCPRCGHCCPEREWVGLTDQEIEDLWNQHESRFDYYSFSCDIEAKLKEKNGG